ncbi:MAG: hypothetical protein ACK418_15705 [Pseudomonas sp.]|uniref:hypothetical protein n=1 Tax=Pseudomonas sp. TaxID=306 RepID=UPI00391C3956
MSNILVGALKFLFKETRKQLISIFYRGSLESSICFTRERGYVLDCDMDLRYVHLVKDVADFLPQSVSMFERLGLVPVVAYGGHCVNIHIGVINFIREKYPDVVANLVVGEVSVDKSIFKFNQAKFLEYINGNGSEISDFHAWINIDSDFIIDCTFGTYINTRLTEPCEETQVESSYGGVIYGVPSDLKIMKIEGLKSFTPSNYSRIIYTPVVVGVGALMAVAPRYQS